MDGNSTDDTMRIINKNLDIISKVVSEEDESGASACNKAIGMSSGDIIGFLYADDYYENNSLDYISRAVIENPNNDKLVLLLKEQINKIEPLIMNT